MLNTGGHDIHRLAGLTSVPARMTVIDDTVTVACH